MNWNLEKVPDKETYRPMSSFLAAMSFLTIIPAGKGNRFSQEAMAHSLAYYSLVGLFLGSVLALVSKGINIVGLGWSGDVLLVAILVLLTGGLHLDGLADTADGVLSSRPREQKLQIMHDSRIGAMGAIALWTGLTLKVALLGELVYPDKALLLFFMPAVGRGAMVWSAVKFPYARGREGLGTFTQEAGLGVLLANAAVLLCSGLLMFGVSSLAVIAVVWAAAHLLSRFLVGLLGGMTGDTYGAVCELSETMALLVGVLGAKLF